MEQLLSLALICLLFLTAVQVLTLSHCVSRAGSLTIDTQCQKYCALGQCPNFCLCVISNDSDTCTKLDYLSNNKLAINETVRPGTPIFTIKVTGQERWSYTLGRGGPVDGSVWNSLSKYLKLTKIANQYEMIVDVTPDLEDIFQKYGIKLTSLKLILMCEGNGLPAQVNEIQLKILPVNEHAPEFFVIPLRVEVSENTPVGTAVYVLGDHTIDVDVSTAPNEVLTFGLWKYLPDVQRDGQAYFQMSDTIKGVIEVKVELDFETLQPMNATGSFLNVSASDLGNMTSYTTLFIDVKDVDDLPPTFNHPSCLSKVTISKLCVVSYEAKIPLHFQGQITNITPGPIQAKDMDTLNDPVKFSLKQETGKKQDIVNKFSINETTGSIFVLSPVVRRSEFQLIIVAREFSKKGRSTEASLLIRAEDTSTVVYMELISSASQVPSIPTRSRSKNTTDALLASTIVLSLCVLLLVFTLCVLCVKLRAKRKFTIHPAAVSILQSDNCHSEMIKMSPEISNIHHSNDGHCTNTSSTSASHDDVKGNELEAESKTVGLSNNHTKQNAARNQSSVIHLMSPATPKNGTKRQLNISKSTLSSLQVKKRASPTLSDYPIRDTTCCGRSSLCNCQNTGKGYFCRQNMFDATDRLFARNDIYSSSNLFILSGHHQADNGHRKHDSVSSYQNFPTGTRSQVEHNQCPDETESTSSDQIQNCVNPGREISKTNVIRESTSFNGDVIKINRSDIKIQAETSKNKQILQCDQSSRDVRDSGDDCNDDESDGGYNDDSSISGASTVSFTESEHFTVSNPKRGMISLLSKKRSSNLRKDENEEMRSYEPFNRNSSSKTLLLTTKPPMVKKDKEHLEELIKSKPRYENEKETKHNSATTNRHNDVPQNSQENVIQFEFKKNSLKIQNSKCRQLKRNNYNKFASMSSSLVHENLAHIEPPDTAESSDKRELKDDMINRHLATRSLSNNLRSTRIWKKEMLTGTAVDPHAVVQTRPHTSDDIKQMKKACSSYLPGRPFSSVPPRLKRKIRHRKKMEDLNMYIDHEDMYVHERPTKTLQRNCGDFTLHNPLQGHQQQLSTHLFPWSIRHLVPELDSVDHLDTHNSVSGYHFGNAHLILPGYDEQVYLNRFRQKPLVTQLQHQLHLDYMIQQQKIQRNHVVLQQQLLQREHVVQQTLLQRDRVIQQQSSQRDRVIQQQQRSHSAPEITGHRHHQPRDKYSGERSKPETIQRTDTSPLEAECQRMNDKQNDSG